MSDKNLLKWMITTKKRSMKRIQNKKELKRFKI